MHANGTDVDDRSPLTVHVSVPFPLLNFPGCRSAVGSGLGPCEVSSQGRGHFWIVQDGVSL